MCTLTYLHDAENNRYILTSNRDESLERGQAAFPQLHEYREKHLIFPLDPFGGGSWIACSLTGQAACLLNGAFEPHTPPPPYRKSRGLVLLDVLTAGDADYFLEHYDLEKIEPFTLILLQTRPETQLRELRWDGNERHLYSIDASAPQIWSASMLYPPDVRLQSRQRFMELLKKKQHVRSGDLMRFNEREKYQAKMERHELEKIKVLRTLSTSQVIITEKEVRFDYHDLLYDVEMQLKTPLK